MPSKLGTSELWHKVFSIAEQEFSYWSEPESNEREQWVEAIKRRILREAERLADLGVESALVPASDDLVGLVQVGQAATEFFTEHLGDSYSAEPGYAVRDDDDEIPGKHKIIFRTRDGAETCYRELPNEVTSAELSSELEVDQASSVCDDVAAELGPDDIWKVFTDVGALPVARMAAFEQLRCGSLASKAIEHLADEVANLDIADSTKREWRAAIVFAAEDSHFSEDLREAIGDKLLRIAAEMRRQADGDDKVVWAALRRGASLLPSSKAYRFLEFLAPGSSIDTRAVALQCIARSYELEPPDCAPQEVADRVYRFAERFLDPDVFTAGDPSLIARNAIYALAALGDGRLNYILGCLRNLGKPWMIRRVRDELSRIKLGWEKRGTPKEHPAMSNLLGSLSQFD